MWLSEKGAFESNFDHKKLIYENSWKPLYRAQIEIFINAEFIFLTYRLTTSYCKYGQEGKQYSIHRILFNVFLSVEQATCRLYINNSIACV